MYSIEDLDSFLRKFKCYEALIEIGKFSRKLFNESKAFENIFVDLGYKSGYQTITQWGLAFIAFRAIMVSNDGRSKNFTFRDLALSNHIYNELNDPFLKDKDIAAFLFRASQEQFWLQEINFPQLWSRYNTIFKFDDLFSKTFFEISGLTVEEYFLIGMACLASVNRDNQLPVIRIDNLTRASVNKSLKQVLTEEKLTKFFNITSRDYLNVRRESKMVIQVTLPGYEKYFYNPLLRYPIVQGDSRYSYYSSFQYLVPNIVLAIDRIAKGIYWDLRDYYAFYGLGEFLEKFGKAFEEYCGILLKELFNQDNVKNVSSLILSEFQEQEHADWIVFEDKKTFIFECKSSLLPLFTRLTFSKSQFEKWVNRNLKKGIKQLVNTENILKTKGLITTQDVYKFVLILEDLHLAEAPYFKNPIMEEVNDNKDLDYSNVYFMRIFELEKLEEAIKKYGFSKIVEKKKEIDTLNGTTSGMDFISSSLEIDKNLKLECKFLKKTFENKISELKV